MRQVFPSSADLVAVLGLALVLTAGCDDLPDVPDPDEPNPDEPESFFSPDRLLLGEEGSKAGYTVAGVGDVNGDGLGDVLVGAYAHVRSESAHSTGAAYLVHGPMGASSESRFLEDEAEAIFYGMEDYESVGRYMDGLGDVNGDGFDDIIFGHPGYDCPELSCGAAHVFLGPVSGELFMLHADVTVTGVQSFENVGRSVAGAGDVDGDGLNDVLVGAPGHDDSSGAAYLLAGPIGEEASLAEPTATLMGEEESRTGFAVAGGGDVNGDGLADLLVGAPRFDRYRGAVYLVHGPVSGEIDLAGADGVFTGERSQTDFNYGDGDVLNVATAGDVNGDGIDDFVVGAPDWNVSISNCAHGAAFLFHGQVEAPGSRSWLTSDATFSSTDGCANVGISTSSAGDVDGDGFDEVLVGAYRINGAFLYRGPVTGLQYVEYAEEVFDEFTWHSEHATDCAGDVNGDGIDDVVAGAYWAEHDGDDSGAAHVFFGELR